MLQKVYMEHKVWQAVMTIFCHASFGCKAMKALTSQSISLLASQVFISCFGNDCIGEARHLQWEKCCEYSIWAPPTHLLQPGLTCLFPFTSSQSCSQPGSHSQCPYTSPNMWPPRFRVTRPHTYTHWIKCLLRWTPWAVTDWSNTRKRMLIIEYQHATG